MSCPAESKTIDKFKKRGYESSDTTGYRPKGGYQPNGVKIIKAVRLYSQKEDNETKMKLEELLGHALIEDQLINSAMGNKCQCEGVEKRRIISTPSQPGWGGQFTGSGSSCICEKVKCDCDSKCRCNDKCKCDGHYCPCERDTGTSW